MNSSMMGNREEALQVTVRLAHRLVSCVFCDNTTVLKYEET